MAKVCYESVTERYDLNKLHYGLVGIGKISHGLLRNTKVKYGMGTVHDGLCRISLPRRFSLVLPDRAILFALPVLGYN